MLQTAQNPANAAKPNDNNHLRVAHRKHRNEITRQSKLAESHQSVMFAVCDTTTNNQCPELLIAHRRKKLSWDCERQDPDIEVGSNRQLLQNRLDYQNHLHARI